MRDGQNGEWRNDKKMMSKISEAPWTPIPNHNRQKEWIWFMRMVGYTFSGGQVVRGDELVRSWPELVQEVVWCRKEVAGDFVDGYGEGMIIIGQVSEKFCVGYWGGYYSSVISYKYVESEIAKNTSIFTSTIWKKFENFMIVLALYILTWTIGWTTFSIWQCQTHLLDCIYKK